jgi:hypothetical protein
VTRLELDHLIVAGPDLDAVLAHVEALVGLRAVAGGRHAGQGTRNALLGLGAGRYLELLGPDPEQTGGAFLDSIAYLEAPALHGWCARAGAAADVAARVAAAGATPRLLPMSRRRPDGVVLRWTLVFADGHPYGGLVPFFIDWQGSPHPSAALPPQLACAGLRLVHPDAAGLAAFLAALGELPDEVGVERGAEPRLRAAWRGPTGSRASEGRGGAL